MGGSREEAEQFVAARWPELRRLTLLVTDPTVGAASPPGRDAAVAVLADAVRHWRRLGEEGRPTEVVRRDFVRRLLSGDQTSDRAAGQPTESPNPVAAQSSSIVEGPAEALARAWEELSGAQRTAYVLSARDRLPSGVVAEAMGMPSAAVRSLADDVSRRLDEANAGSLATVGREANPVALQDDLAQMLDERQWSGPDWGELGPLLGARVGAGRTRGRALAAAGGVVVLALAAGAYVWERDPGAPTTATTESRRSAAPLPTRSGELIQLATWPARGALSHDPRTAAAVTARLGDNQRVLWADDVDGRRYVWTTARQNTNQEPTSGHLLSGPAGAEIADLTDTEVWIGPSAYSVVALVTGPAGAASNHLVVLAAPGTTRAEWSRTVSITRALAVERTWEPLDLRDGVAVLPLPAPLPALSVRALDRAATGLAQLNTPFTRADVPCPDCPGPPEINGRLGAARADVAAATGLPPSAIAVEVQYAGPLPALPVPATGAAGDGQSFRYAYAALLRLPSGAVLQTVEMLGATSEVAGTAASGSPATPGGAGAAEEWQPMRWEEPLADADLGAPIVMPMFAPSGTGQMLTAIVPAGSAVTEIAVAPSGSPDPAPRVRVKDGGAVVTVPMSTMDGGGPIIQAYDASGTLLSATPLFGAPRWWGPYDALRSTMPDGATLGSP